MHTDCLQIQFQTDPLIQCLMVVKGEFFSFSCTNLGGGGGLLVSHVGGNDNTDLCVALGSTVGHKQALSLCCPNHCLAIRPQLL